MCLVFEEVANKLVGLNQTLMATILRSATHGVKQAFHLIIKVFFEHVRHTKTTTGLIHHRPQEEEKSPVTNKHRRREARQLSFRRVSATESLAEQEEKRIAASAGINIELLQRIFGMKSLFL
eukprot:TRINITY_DN21194_c0_g1_i1.p1 TRINITY_DN21194_c0_g1~~TRINITY_DN21194_c0_g1_i1.p1  ORF type:complete len:122 (-),score=21.54 TRINITY_DN21194_c0_g1_i1:27-392(-)